MQTINNNSDNECVDYLKLSPSTWKRPGGPPRVWRIVEGRRKTTDGQIPRFSIQEVPEDFENEVVEFIIKYFISEEPMSVDMGLANDPLAVREFRTLWRDFVHQGASVVAFKLHPDPTAKPVIAGVNILTIKTAEDETKSEGKLQFETKSMKKVMGALSKLGQELDVLKVYGVDKYLAACGLSVHPSFRGQGLGEELLRARDDIGRAYRIPVSGTIFTGNVAQTLATRVGFEVLLERKFSEYLDDEGKVAFPGVTVKYIKIMGKRLY